MYNFYCYLKDWNTPPTKDEKDIVAAKKPLEASKIVKLKSHIKSQEKNLKKAFIRQQEQVLVMRASSISISIAPDHDL